MTARSFSDLVSRQLRTSGGKVDSRKKLIGAVHAASAKAGISEDDRRAIYAEVTGKRSMSDMNLAEVGAVLDRLNRNAPKRNAARPHIAKVKALWWTLYWLGEASEPNDAALDAFVKRQTGLASLRFLDHRHAPSVIEALKDMARRAGVRWPGEADAKALQAVAGVPITLQQVERHAVLAAIWTRLLDRRLATLPLYAPFVERALGLSPNHHAWTERQLDDAIKLLGKKLRRAMAKDDRG